jgi:hypothetical protein
MDILRIIVVLLIGAAIIIAIFLGYWVLETILMAISNFLSSIPFWLLLIGGIGFYFIIFRRR